MINNTCESVHLPINFAPFRESKNPFREKESFSYLRVTGAEMGSPYLPTRTGKRWQEPERIDKRWQEMFYGDKRLSFNLFEYIIVSRYVFDGCLIEITFVKCKRSLKEKGNTEHYLFRRLTAFTDKRYFWWQEAFL